MHLGRLSLAALVVAAALPASALAAPPANDARADATGLRRPAGAVEAGADHRLRARELVAEIGDPLRGISVDGDVAPDGARRAPRLRTDGVAHGEEVLAEGVLGRAVRIGRAMYAHPDAVASVRARVEAIIAAEGSITLARLRDELATSRRYAQALLEHLDAERVTKRLPDDSRVLRRR